MMNHIQMNFNDLNINIKLNKNITILKDYSGTGKTFLFKILMSYFQENNISFVKFDYTSLNLTVDDIKQQIMNKDFILMDCADLYMTRELWGIIKSSESYFIISLKGLDNIIIDNNLDICIVNYFEDSLNLETLL